MNNRIVATLLSMALALPASGCWKEQQQAMKVCQAQIPYQGKFPPVTRTKTPIVMCMEKAGYVRDFHNSRCTGTAVPRRNEACYRPRGFFAALGFRIEMFSKPPAPPPATNIH